MILFKKIESEKFNDHLYLRYNIRFINRIGTCGYYFGDRQIAHEEHIAFLGILYLAEKGWRLFQELDIDTVDNLGIKDRIFKKIEDLEVEGL